VEHPRANWSQAVVTGLPAIDSQHKQLFDMAASFRNEGDQIADRIEDLINGWFYQHILTVDAEYVAAVKARHTAP